MTPTCTKCFGARTRQPSTFVERFTDSAWCSSCFAAWLVGLDDAPVAVSGEVDQAITIDPSELCSAPQGEVG